MTVVVVLCVCPLVASVGLFCKTTFAYKQGACDTDSIQVAIFKRSRFSLRLPLTRFKDQACPAHTLRGLRRRQWLSSASVNRTTRCARLTPPTRKPGVIRESKCMAVARGHLLCVVLRAWADGPAGWDAPGMWLPRRHSSAVRGRRSQALSTAAGARVEDDRSEGQ